MKGLTSSVLSGISSEWIAHSIRTAVGAVVALLPARLATLPVAYWASITTLIVMQWTLGAAGRFPFSA